MRRFHFHVVVLQTVLLVLHTSLRPSKSFVINIYHPPNVVTTTTTTTRTSVSWKSRSRRNGDTSKAMPTPLYAMKRPLLDRIASSLFKLENRRVESSSEVDSKGRKGEPMAWSESSSVANWFSQLVASNEIGYRFKQWVADLVAGDYDEEEVRRRVDAWIETKPTTTSSSRPAETTGAEDVNVVMFSFTTCPFCRRAKDYLEDRGIAYRAIELDTLEMESGGGGTNNDGNAVRAVLGKMTKRTSVPSIFVNGVFIGGCNDGPGLIPLAESGKLDELLLLPKGG